jgi:hypothetical protein
MIKRQDEGGIQAFDFFILQEINNKDKFFILTFILTFILIFIPIPENQ